MQPLQGMQLLQVMWPFPPGRLAVGRDLFLVDYIFSWKIDNMVLYILYVIYISSYK